MIVGVDFNARAIHVAGVGFAPDGPNGEIGFARGARSYAIDEPDGPTRSRLAGETLYRLLDELERRAGDEISAVAIELPAGKIVAPVLRHHLGAMTLAAGLHTPRVEWLPPARWRSRIGVTGRAVNTKAGGNRRVLELVPAAVGLGEDYLDALGVALAMQASTIGRDQRSKDRGS